MKLKSFTRSEFENSFQDIMITSAAEDSRLHEVITAMLFRTECPEGRIWEAETTADIADYYALNPEAMQQAFILAEEKYLTGGKYE